MSNKEGFVPLEVDATAQFRRIILDLPVGYIIGRDERIRFEREARLLHPNTIANVTGTFRCVPQRLIVKGYLRRLLPGVYERIDPISTGKIQVSLDTEKIEEVRSPIMNQVEAEVQESMPQSPRTNHDDIWLPRIETAFGKLLAILESAQLSSEAYKYLQESYSARVFGPPCDDTTTQPEDSGASTEPWQCRRRWSASDKAILRKLAGKKPTHEIAARLGRTEGGIRSYAHLNDLSLELK